ncbi:MAG: histidine kinase dimerization/phosphoacceptor domain -containing protein [Spirochaetota bacterium]
MERKGTSLPGQPFPLPLAALARRLSIIVIILNMFALLAVGLLIRQSLIQYESEASALSRNIAGILDANISGIIAKVDIALLAVTDEAERQLAKGPIDAASFNRFIVREHARIPEAESFRAADASGLAIYGPDVPVATTKSLAHRDYFKYLHDNRETALVFSDPLVGGISGKWMILFVRRISAPDGGFAGLVYVGVTLDYLTKAFSAFDVGRFGTIELRDRNLKLVSHFPMHGDPGVAMAEDRVDPPLVGLAAAGKLEGQYFAGGLSSGQKSRIVSFRRVGTYPFLVCVSLVREEYQAQCYKEAWTLGFIALAFALVTLVIAILFYRNARRNRLAAGQLLDQEEKFRTVADYTHDWEFWLDPSGAFNYSSPSCRRVSGYEAADFYGNPSFIERIIHPEDLALYREHVSSVHKEKGFSVFSFRIIRADGEERWIEHLCQPVTAASGAYLGTRGSNRDITERRLADGRIQALLAEKELLLTEVHHRIKNNMTVIMSLLELQAITDEETSARKILQTASNRVRSMTLLYEKLYLARNTSGLSIREYFTPLLKEIHETFPGHGKVELDLDFADLVLDADKLSRIGIILNELVTNSMKHAFKGQDRGRISVAAVLVGSRVVISCRDNGEGLAGGSELEKHSGFGLGMIELLVHQLGGTMSIDRERGFSFRMEFDHEKPRQGRAAPGDSPSYDYVSPSSPSAAAFPLRPPPSSS